MMSIVGKTVTLKPTEGAYQKIYSGVVVHETATQFSVEAEGFRRAKFRKSDGMPAEKIGRRFPCYKAEIVDSKSRTESAPTTLVMGEVKGRCELPAHVVAGAARLAGEFFTAQEEHEWSGDQVETYAEPLWLKRAGAPWRPDVSHLGLIPTGEQSELVVTAGVDSHIDDFHGLVLVVVLHNDGLKFKQGRVSIAPAAGDWFIFDDRRKHGVSSAPGHAVFVGWAIPLKPGRWDSYD